MINNLLATKLHIPRPRRELVPRPRLNECMNNALSGKLTVVSAPAGYGKTTALTRWIDHSQIQTAWFSIDEADNDLVRFLTYLIAALQRLDEKIGLDVQSALSESQTASIEILLTRLVNEIEEAIVSRGFEDQFVLVIDDYHIIKTQSVHEALNFLLDNFPTTLHLVVAGRSDPPVPISRLRVQGEVTEVRVPDLRFTQDEVTAFLNDLMGFDLTVKEITALEKRTEGWIASLQLAALSMQERGDIEAFIADFSGSHRYIIDYLIDEVISRQPEGLQGFLCQTSILDRYCAPLCDAALEITNSRQIMDQLEKTNLFLIPLDDERHWYRYHHLFADSLGQRLREADPEHIPVLHRRASQWFEDEHLMDEAIQHALSAGEMENATRLVNQVAADFVVRRESNKLLQLLNQLPSDGYRDYPMLNIWHAWALLFIGQLDAVEPILDIVDTSRNKTPEVPLSGYLTTIRAYLANQRGKLAEAIDLSEQALELMSDAPGDRITLIYRGAAIIWLGVNHRLLGNLEIADRYFKEAALINQKAGSIYAALASYEQLAELALMRGQLHQAVDIYQRGFQMARNWRDENSNVRGDVVAVGGPHLGLGATMYQMNDLSGAAIHIQRGATLFESGELWGRMHSYRLLAYLEHAAGDYQTALDLLTKATMIQDNIAVRQSNTADLPSLEQLRILLSRTHPEMAYLLTDAARRVEENGLRPDDNVDFASPAGYPRESGYSDLVRVLIEQGREAEALPLLERMLEAAQSRGRNGDEIRYLILKALAYHSLGERKSALSILALALIQAQPEGYVRIFVDEGRPMADMLEQAVSQNIEPVYARELLTAFPEYELQIGIFDGDRSTLHQTLIEPLSERELDVLRLMAVGFTYQEIAGKLVISVNTVRHHTRNIYGKLDVHNRIQAIARSKELDLI